MAQQKGSTTTIGINNEVTFGTAVTSGFICPINSTSISKTVPRNTPATLQGNRNSAKPFKGNTDVAGDIVVPVDTIALWYWLKAAFGVPVQTFIDPEYQYVFKVPASQPSFSHQKSFTDLATSKFITAVGCKTGSLTLELGGDGELTLSLSITGRDETTGLSTVYSGGETTVALGERINNFDAVIKEGGATSSQIKTCSISVDFGLDTDQRVIGDGGKLATIPGGITAVTGNIKGIFEDDILLAKAEDDTESAIQIIFTPGVASTHLLTVDIQELQYSYKSPMVDGPQGLEIDLDFSGYYEDGAAVSGIMFTLLNLVDHGL
jgi:hypothetical protein